MQPAGPNPFISVFPMLVMFMAIYYFLLIRPQQKKEKDRQKMLQSLKKGDRVVTSGGIIGTVLGVRDDVVVLKVGDGETKIEFLKNAVTNLATAQKE